MFDATSAVRKAKKAKHSAYIKSKYEYIKKY
jgi:hypothetical protein